MPNFNSDYVENSDSRIVPQIESNKIYTDRIGQKREYDGSIINFDEAEQPSDLETEIEGRNLGGYSEEGVFTDYVRPGKRSLPENESDEELHLGYQNETMFERAGFHIDPDMDFEEPPLREERTDLDAVLTRESYNGDHYGKGPKGYRRSDKRIEEDINERLTAHPGVDATDMEVRVVYGEVTISGRAYDKRSKRLAEDIAYLERGVQQVHNRIRIR